MIIIFSILVILVFGFGIIVGWILRHQMPTSYSGSIIVSKTPEKTLYSLELDENPENLEFKRHVLFRVRTLPDDESNRE